MIKFIESMLWQEENGEIKPANDNQKINYLLESNGYPAYSFAPGTYIELETKLDSIESKNIKWAYISFDLNKKQNINEKIKEILESNLESNNVTYKEIKDESGFFTKYNMYDKIGFYLPVLTENENISNDNKQSYVVIFAFDSKNKKPTLLDSHLVLDISFRVSVNTTLQINKFILNANKLLQDAKADLYMLNKVSSIQNIDEVFMFIYGCRIAYLKQHKDSNLNLKKISRIYPPLEGKIAYIYHIFNVSNEDLLRNMVSFASFSINEKYMRNHAYFPGEEYCDERREFANRFYNVLMQDNYYISRFKKYKAFNIKQKHELIESFLQRFADSLGIKKEFRPCIKFIDNMRILGKYVTDLNNIELNITTFRIEFNDLLRVIIHEYRHFYLHYITSLDTKHKLHNNFIIRFIESSTIIDINKQHKSFGSVYELSPCEKDANAVELIFVKLLRN